MPLITQAFILGAGLGIRLRPLTDDLPKPLIPIFGKPLVTFALDHLIAAGVRSFLINTHHHPASFRELFAERSYRDYPLQLVHEPDILGTGGGIKNVELLLRSEVFIVYSGDVLSDIDLKPLIDEHLSSGNDVTLALRDTGLGRDMALDGNRVVDLENRYGRAGRYDFAGISLWTPAIFERIPFGRSVSFIPILGQWIGEGGKIGGLVLNDGQWFNIGSPAQYLEAHRAISEMRWKPAYVKAPDWPVYIAPDAIVDPSARLSGFHSIGPDCQVGAAAILHDTILWPGARIASRSDLRNCIVRARHSASGVVRDTII